MAVNFLQNIEDFLTDTGTAIEDSYLGESWESLKNVGSDIWNHPVNTPNRILGEQVVIPTLQKVSPVLDAPLNAMQGGLATGSTQGLMRGLMQEEDYNYGQALPQKFQDAYPNITGAVRNTGEVLGDPLNLLTGGTLGLATKNLSRLSDANLSPASFKGLYASSPANYIDNFYGGSPDVPLTFVEKAIDVALDKMPAGKYSNLSEEKRRAFAQKVTGVSRWAMGSAKAAGKNFLNPESRALYAELGINKNTQEVIRKQLAEAEKDARASKVQSAAEYNKHLLKTPERTRPFQKAVAQVHAGDSIGKQAGRVGGIHPSVTNVVDKVTLGGVGPLAKNRYIEHVLEGQSITKSTTGGVGKTRNFTPDKADLSFAFDAIQKIWAKDLNGKGTPNLVVKKTTGSGGDHATDAIKDNPSKGLTKAMFAKLAKDGTKPTIETMYNTLKQISFRGTTTVRDEAGFVVSETPKKLKRAQGVVVLNPSLEHAQKHGLWLASSRSGKGIKEGGVNVLTKINPNMTTMAFVSDVHNFLEKGPLKPMMQRTLPNDELTITPPIFTDLRPKESKGRINYSNKSKDTDGHTVDIAHLRDIANAKPSKAAVKAVKDQSTRRRRGGLFTGAALHQGSKLTGGQEE